MVWLLGDKGEAEKQAALVAEQHGIVRSKAKFGVRVAAATFEKVFRQLRPGAAVPPPVQVKLTLKAGPFPAGTSAEDVSEWASKLHWPIKVLKALGPRFWLLGAEVEPPAFTTHFNQTAVLITRTVPSPVIQAGGPLPTGPSPPGSTTAEDPWLESDPWRQLPGVENCRQRGAGQSGPTFLRSHPCRRGTGRWPTADHRGQAC